MLVRVAVRGKVPGPQGMLFAQTLSKSSASTRRFDNCLPQRFNTPDDRTAPHFTPAHLVAVDPHETEVSPCGGRAIDV